MASAVEEKDAFVSLFEDGEWWAEGRTYATGKVNRPGEDEGLNGISGIYKHQASSFSARREIFLLMRCFAGHSNSNALQFL